MIRVRPPEPSDAAFIVEQVSRITAAAISGVTADDWLSEIADGHRGVIVVERGGERVGIVVLSHQPPALHAHGVAGVDVAEWFGELDGPLREIARERGANRIIAWVRPGLARIARRHGWRESHREITVEVG